MAARPGQLPQQTLPPERAQARRECGEPARTDVQVRRDALLATPPGHGDAIGVQPGDGR